MNDQHVYFCIYWTWAACSWIPWQDYPGFLFKEQMIPSQFSSASLLRFLRHVFHPCLLVGCSLEWLLLPTPTHRGWFELVMQLLYTYTFTYTHTHTYTHTKNIHTHTVIHKPTYLHSNIKSAWSLWWCNCLSPRWWLALILITYIYLQCRFCIYYTWIHVHCKLCT